MFRVVVHLVNGSSVAGKAMEVTDEERLAFKDSIADVAGSSDKDGWQVNVESENGSWVVVPKNSILYVELERVS